MLKNLTVSPLHTTSSHEQSRIVMPATYAFGQIVSSQIRVCEPTNTTTDAGVRWLKPAHGAAREPLSGVRLT